MRKVAALALLGLLAAGPAEAHKLKVFAAAEGEVISGYAYYFGGGRAIGTRVIISGADGARVAELQTDAEGAFRFQTKEQKDYRVTAESADGHACSTTIAAADLAPAPLPDPGYAAMLPQEPQAPVVATGTGDLPPDVGVLVEAAVARQVRPLREQLDAWTERVFWRDVLGGLGFIVGIAGLAYGLTARREKK